MDRLTEAELTHYRERGYVVPSVRLLQKLMKLIERRLGTFLSSNPELSPNYIGGLLEQDVSWISIARQPQILDTVEQLIGPDFLIWEVALITKGPRVNQPTPWQQNGEFWPIRPLSGCTVWIALDGTTPDRGCLRMVPASHLTQELFVNTSGTSEELGEYRAIRDQDVADSNGEDVVLTPSQLCIQNVYTVHGWRPNPSDQPSRFVAMRFMPTTSHFDCDLAAIHAQGPNVEDLTGQQLHLMRGEDICRRNNFSVGRQSSTVTTHVGRVH